MANPFNISFGKEPSRLISRSSQVNTVIETFNSESPSTQAYMMTGVRGAGKTVTMTYIEHELVKDSQWISVPLNPNTNLLDGFASHLCMHKVLEAPFKKADINISLFNMSASITSDKPAATVEVQLLKMLNVVKTLNKKVLITIDEVVKNQQMIEFASAFQTFVREDYPVFLLMTGLFENIRNLQNENTLTFLYRTPRIDLKPLGIVGMANDYKEVFNISSEEAEEMARFTKGYPYAFQTLGYIKWEENKDLNGLIPRFDSMMEDFVYEKIWSELSEGDKKVLSAIARNNGRMKTSEVQAATGNTSSSFSTYRKLLLEKGLIDTSDYGYVELSLPRFGEIVNAWNY
jgi:Cdc6-like AAA superfamily ATPase